MGPPAALLELVEVGALELLVSDACIEELREVLTRPSLQRKFPSLSISSVQDFLDRIQACSVYSVNIANIFVLDRDPKDAKYVDLAIATKADFLVTRDKDLLDLRNPIQTTRTLHNHIALQRGAATHHGFFRLQSRQPIYE